MTAFIAQNFVPLLFCGLLCLPADRHPGGLRPGRHRPAVRLHRHGSRPVPEQPVPGAAAARVRHHEQRHAAGDPVLHLHGHHPRALRHGRGPARDRRPGLRPGARRLGRGGDPGRRAAGGHHRRGRRGGDLDGPDLAADHAALRLQPHHRHRHHHRLGHAGAGHPAVAGADRAGRPDGPLGGRHVRRRAVSRACCWSACTCCSSPRWRSSSRSGCRRCRQRRASTASPTAPAATTRCWCCWRSALRPATRGSQVHDRRDAVAGSAAKALARRRAS